jgi:hypothetical protein
VATNIGAKTKRAYRDVLGFRRACERVEAVVFVVIIFYVQSDPATEFYRPSSNPKYQRIVNGSCLISGELDLS